MKPIRFRTEREWIAFEETGRLPDKSWLWLPALVALNVATWALVLIASR